MHHENRNVRKFIDFIDTFWGDYNGDQFQKPLIDLASRIRKDPTTDFNPVKYTCQHKEHYFAAIVLARAGFNHHWDDADTDHILDLPSLILFEVTKTYPLPRTIALSYFTKLIQQHNKGNKAIESTGDFSPNTFSDLTKSDRENLIEYAKNYNIEGIVAKSLEKIPFKNLDEIKSKIDRALENNSKSHRIKRRTPKA